MRHATMTVLRKNVIMTAELKHTKRQRCLLNEQFYYLPKKHLELV